MAKLKKWTVSNTAGQLAGQLAGQIAGQLARQFNRHFNRQLNRTSSLLVDAVRRCYFTAFAPKAQRPALLFHGLSAEGAKAGVVDTQTPNDPSFIYVLGRFVLKILYLSKPFMGPCDSVR